MLIILIMKRLLAFFRLALLGLITLLSVGYGLAEQSYQKATLPTPVQLPDEIVYSPNREKSAYQEIGSQVGIVSQTDLNAQQYHTFEEALRPLAGVTLSRTGLNGPSQFFIRGIGGEHSLVLVDGVPLGDPMGTGRFVDFSLLGVLGAVEHIEVLKGAQSPLYGSNAMGGVIHIFTPNTHDNLAGHDTPRIRWHSLWGSRKTSQTAMSIVNQGERFGYRLAGSLDNRGGIDATKYSQIPQDKDKDRAKNRQAFGRFSYFLNENIDFEGGFIFNRRYYEYDTDFPLKGHDYWRARVGIGFLGANFSLLDNRWESTLRYHVYRLKRKAFGALTWNFYGRTEELSLHNELRLQPNFKTIFGLNFKKEQGASYGREEKERKPTLSQTIGSIYLNQHGDFYDRFFTTLGFRYDRNSEFGGHFTYRFTGHLKINDKVALKGSYGTGFNAPNLYQFYDEWVGNPHLKAETSQSWEGGLVVKPSLGSELEFTYFSSRYRNLIDYQLYDLLTFRGGYENIGRAKIKGIELTGKWLITPELEAKLSYTHLNAKEQVTEEGLISERGTLYQPMLRRPHEQLSLSFKYQPSEKWLWAGESVYYGRRIDKNRAGERVSLGGFTLFNLSGRYTLHKSIDLTVKVTNLFDKTEYTYAHGYNEPGRGYFVGFEVAL